MIEMAPATHHSMMGTIWNMSEGFVFVILTLLFRFVSKDWRLSVTIGLEELVVGYLILAFVLPESPKWLYDKGRYKECSEALSSMAKINKIQNSQTPEISRLKYFNQSYVDTLI